MHIFSSLSYEELLSSCLHASTYNQKETVKALGHKMPREQILSRKWMGTVVCETVSVFSTGAASKNIHESDSLTEL